MTVTFVAGSTLFKIGGSDVWFHIATGRWIWEHGEVPRTDVFSHTFVGQPLVYTEALAQLIFFKIWEMGGPAGLVLLKAAIIALIALVVIKLCKAGAGPTALVLALWSVSSHFRLAVRPEVFSFLCFAVATLIIRRADREVRFKVLWWLVPLAALWSNLHRAGVLLVILLVVAASAWLLDARRRRGAAIALAVLVLVMLGSMLNSSGSRALTSVFEDAGGEAYAKLLTEWASLSLDTLLRDDIPFTVLAAAWIIGWLVRRRHLSTVDLTGGDGSSWLTKIPYDFEVGTVIAMTAMAYLRVRFIPYAALAMTPGVASDLNAAIEALNVRTGGRLRQGLLHLLLWSTAVSLIGYHYDTTYTPAERGLGVEWEVPVEAGEFLAQNRPPGKMWNSFNLGGYLLFRLAPETPVFIDGRTGTLYGQEFLAETVEASTNPQTLAEQFQRYDITFAVLEYFGFGDNKFATLYASPNWVLVYWDDRVVVLVKRSPETAQYIAEHGYKELKVGQVEQRIDHWQEEPRKRELLGELIRNTREAPLSIRAHYMLAVALRAAGEVEGYERERRIVERLANSRSLDIRVP
ncbi:MAG: hypothetical protein CO108_18555 [Deltaproteobacteria bacterium CG_4_9_14_3_um_filter_63_12]|nr:MAG: hypothetical protein CO108_18555 [Deltaproteobacteria bacterium CG_4_9_14_3_um_filter_63_12]